MADSQDVVELAIGGVRARAAATALRPAAVLAAIAGLSIAVRLPLVLGRATPRYFPDEYLYGELARSFARSRDLRVLDASSSLPSLLAPVVQSLAWLPGDAELAFRLTQTLHVVVMSLAVVPAYLIARRLGIGPSLAFGAAAFAVACPDLLYSGYVTADALGYTLALVAIHAAVRALAAPTLGSQAWLLATVAAAAATRAQYVVLLPAAVVASLVVARGRPGRAVRELWLVWALLVVGGVAVAVAGAAALGRYGSLASAGVSADGVAWLPVSGYLLALAAGAAVAPGAVAWICSELGRPTSRASASFAALVPALLLALAAAAAVLSVHTGSDRFFERYLMIGVPLAGIACAGWLQAGRPGRRIALATAALMIFAATQVPVAAEAEGQGRADSPLLLAVSWPERWLGVGTASLAVALVATAAVLAGLIRPRGRGRPAPALAVSLALMGLVSAGAHAADLSLSKRVVAGQAGSPPTWVDDAGASDVLLVQTWGSEPSRAMTQAFWNSSVTRGALLGDRTEALDGAVERLEVDRLGRLSLRGHAVTGTLLVADDGSRAVFAAAETIARDASFRLVRPHGPARLALLAEGLRPDGWLGRRARLALYPPAQGCRSVVVTLALRAGARPVTVRIDDGARPRTARVTPGRSAALSLLSSSDRPRIALLALTGSQPSAPGTLRPRSVRADLAIRPVRCVAGETNPG